MIRFESDLEPDEQVLLFPSYGRQLPDNETWRFHVRGVVFDPQDVRLRKRMLLRVLRRLLPAESRELESELFQSRVEAFASATEGGKRITIRAGNLVVPLKNRSRRNGHFQGAFRLTQDDVDQLRSDGQIENDRLIIRVQRPTDSEPEVVGRIHMLESNGWSVVSDIDDTIKHTNVTSRRELLANTFLREFRCVQGMAAVYQAMAERGAEFHYVSSSPWQLYTPLAELCDTSGFPNGTFHLRSFRLHEHMLRRFRLHRYGKAVEIRRLLENFPDRRFILIGDSGERDPEIYGRLARRYPDQIRAVFIRQLDERPLVGERTRKVIARLSDDTLRSFENPEQLAQFCRELI